MLLTAGAVPNPVSPWLVLTSGMATGFGAMAGLLALPALLRRADPAGAPHAPALRVGPAWLVAGAAAALVFVGVFGPGVRVG